MKNKKIKAILFDMVGVLLFVKKDFIPSTRDEINASNIEKLYNHIDDQKLLEDINKELKLSDYELKKALGQIPLKFKKYDKLWNILSELKKKYGLAVINNGNALAMRYWNKFFDFSIFDCFVNSAQERIKKPDQRIFLLTCNKMKVKPEECIFMDDSLENVIAAKKLGMTTVWWNRDNTKNENFDQFIKLIGKI